MTVTDTQVGAGIAYRTAADGTVHATYPGNTHELVWTPDPDDPAKGSVRLDGQGRPMGLHLATYPFHVQAESFFGVRYGSDQVAAALEEAAYAVERLVEATDALRYATGDSPRLYTAAHYAFRQYGTGHTLREFAVAYTVGELAAQMRSVALAVRESEA